MTLTLDIGNTSAKIVIFNEDEIIFRAVVQRLTIKELSKIFSAYPIKKSILSAVKPVAVAIINRLKKNSRLIIFSYNTPVPLKNKYSTPKTLGKDRLANAIAANAILPGNDVLIVDTGTCIKYDLVTKNGDYVGGGISPGMRMRFAALHHYTARLPLLDAVPDPVLTGHDTNSSIRSGVINGMIAEINGIIDAYRKKYKNIKIILTGGDAARFEDSIKMSIFAAADLVNIGLNEIVNYNAGKK
jgi:type III pantothenate kinase